MGAPDNKSTQIPVGFDYVLIIEWLMPNDARTGSQLHQYLLNAGIPSALVVCNAWEQVHETLSAAASEISTKGVPAIHLETHGSSPWEGSPEDIGFGADQSSRVPWAELGDWLSRLNAASDFRLLFVSAACWGSGVIGAIGGGEHPAPFAFAIGFRTEVEEGRLRDSMKEFYRGMRTGLPLPECVASAQRELTEGRELRLEIAVLLAIKIVRTVYYDPDAPSRTTMGPLRRRRRARGVWDTWFPPTLQKRVPAYRFEVARIEW